MTGKLSARKAATVGAGKHADGGGLYLFVSKEGRRWWNFLFTIRGKRRAMSLGSYQNLPLAEARESAASARKLVRAGIDPIEDRRREGKSVPTFGEIADGFIDSRKHVWRDAKWETRWRRSLVSVQELTFLRSEGSNPTRGFSTNMEKYSDFSFFQAPMLPRSA